MNILDIQPPLQNIRYLVRSWVESQKLWRFLGLGLDSAAGIAQLLVIL
jgi:hypothetical protein